MGNIYLIGFMGCGKSTVSRYLCKRYGFKRLEMDEEIERQEGRSIKEIFASSGEAYFREVETGLLKKLRSSERLVVSCGGGTAMKDENVSEMKKNGIIILLEACPETVYDRVKHNHNRPLLEGNMNVDYIRGLMEQRRPKYEAAADFTVITDGKSTAQICREILDRTEERENRKQEKHRQISRTEMQGIF